MTMRWCDVSFERREWRIPRTKNNDPHTITLSPEAVEILYGRKSASEFVFSGAGAHGHLIEPRKVGCEYWHARGSMICASTTYAERWEAGKRKLAQAW